MKNYFEYIVLRKLYLAVLILLISISCFSIQKVESNVLNIIPFPREQIRGKGEFKLNRNTKFYLLIPSDTLKQIVNIFNEKIKTATGYYLSVSEREPIKDFIIIDVSTENNLGKEEYTVVVDKKKIAIKASTYQGAFYGFQTLFQLLPPEIESPIVVGGVAWTIPVVSIKDKPRFPYRGYMLDVGRHYFSTEFIKKQIDILAMFKINRFHWHFTDDQGWRVEIKKYPKLIEIGSKRIEINGKITEGYYTYEQMKEIVDYAAKRYITVVPEIEMPGHSVAALASYPQLSCTGGPFAVPNYWKIEKDIYCAGKEETFQYIENILTEIAAIFPGEYIHIGGDEVPKDRWDSCQLCQKRIVDEKLKDADQLQSYFIQRIEKIAAKLGKKIIGWDEILEGGIAPSAAVMSWRGEKGGIEAANSSHNVIMTPYSHLYFDYYQGDKLVEPIAPSRTNLLSNVYSYEPVPSEIDPAKSHYVLGAQANMWTEFVSTTELVEYLTYPRIIALAELTWTPKESKNFHDFTNRLENLQRRLDYRNVNYHIPMPEGPQAKILAFLDSIIIPFTNTRNYPMVFTIDGSEPNVNSKKYTLPLHLTDSKSIKIATVLSTGKLSSVRTINVEKQSLLPSFNGITNKGFLKKNIDGLFLTKESLRDVEFSVPQIIMDFPNSKSFGIEKNFVEVYEGYVEVPVDGVYTFACDKEMLWIADKLLIDNYEMLHRNLVNRSQIALSKGKHKFKMLINNIPVKGHLPERNINTFWLQGPIDKELKQVDPKVLSH